jgi:hypothetical protein
VIATSVGVVPAPVGVAATRVGVAPAPVVMRRFTGGKAQEPKRRAWHEATP